MSIATVRSVEGEGFLPISFTFEGKDRKMQRSKNEVLSKALTRAELSSKKKAKKVKRSADLKISIGKTPKNHEEFLRDRNTQYRDYLQKHTIFSIFFKVVLSETIIFVILKYFRCT